MDKALCMHMFYLCTGIGERSEKSTCKTGNGHRVATGQPVVVRDRGGLALPWPVLAGSLSVPLSLRGLAVLAAGMPVAGAGWPGRFCGLLVCTGRFDEAGLRPALWLAGLHGAGLAQPVLGLQACTCSSSPFRLATRFVLWPKVFQHVHATGNCLA